MDSRLDVGGGATLSAVQSMSGTRRKQSAGSKGIILLTVLIDMIGFGIVIPVLPLYAERFDASGWQIGLLVASFSICQFVFAPVIGRLSDRYGRRPVLLVSILGTAVGFLIMGVAGALWMLFLGRIIDGISGANIGTAQAYMADITTPEERSKSMGLIGAAIGMGFVFGPALGGLMAGVSPSAPFLLAFGLALVNALLVAWRLPESLGSERRMDPADRAPLRDVLRHVRADLYVPVVIGYFLAICGFSVMTTVWALFLKHVHGYDARQAGYLFAMIGVIGVVMQGGVLRRLLRREGAEKPVVLGGCLILAAATAWLPWTTTLVPLLLAGAGIAIGNSLVTPVLNGLASRSVADTWQGRALGILQSGGSLARSVGPMLAGGLLLVGPASGPGYAGVALTAGAVLVLVSLLVLIRIPRNPGGPVTAGG